MDGNPLRPDQFDNSVSENAEMIFRAKSARGDYHDNYDTDGHIHNVDGTWNSGCCRRSNQNTGTTSKTLVLVLDNTPYHHDRCEDGFFPNEHSKIEYKE